MSAARRIGLALTGHHLGLDAILRTARAADHAGFEVVLVDGDDVRVPRRPSADLYDGTVVCSAILERTQRVRAGSIRLPGFTHVIHTARALSTLQATSTGRAVAFFGVGSGRHLDDLGIHPTTPGERVAALESTLDLVRSLWSGRPVTAQRAPFTLHGITAPAPDVPIPVVVAAAGRRALGLVARYADIWDANVPPVRRHLESARDLLGHRLETWLWVFARPGACEEEAIAAYRHHCPWFPQLAADEYRTALLFGDPSDWPGRLEELSERLAIDLPVLDLIGLPEAAVAEAIRPWRPAEPWPMA